MVSGYFTLGVPKDHSCIEHSFDVPGGRLICTKRSKGSIMCIPTCKKGLILRTGYSTHSSVVSKFPIYICNHGSLFWTDVKSKPLALPNPRCLEKNDFLTEVLADDKDEWFVGISFNILSRLYFFFNNFNVHWMYLNLLYLFLSNIYLRQKYSFILSHVVAASCNNIVNQAIVIVET